MTLVAGMVLRNVVFGDGTATSFVIVAALFLALFLIGWRLAFGLIERRSTRADSPSTPAAPII